MNKILSRFILADSKSAWRFLRDLLTVLAAVMVGLAVAFLIVEDKWQVAAVLIFSVPAFLILQRQPFLGILVWLVLDPFLMHTEASTVRQVYWVIHRFLPLFTLAVILLPSALGLSSRALPRLGFPELMMGSYVTVSLASIFAVNPEPFPTAYLFYDRIIVPMLLYLIVRLTRPDEYMMRWLIPVAFFLAISQSLIGTVAWFSPGILPRDWVDHENHRTIGTLVNTNGFVTTMVLAGFLVFHYGHQSSSFRIRAASILTFLLTVYSIFLSFSRAGWLAGALALIGLVAIYPRILMRIGLSILPILILASGIFLQNQLTFASQRLASDQSENSAFSRLPVIMAAIRMFMDKPLLGWGYGNFDSLGGQFRNMPISDFAGAGEILGVDKLLGDEKDHASHNFFLTTAAEQGLIGVIFFLAPLAYWLKVTVNRFSKLPKNGFWSRNLLVVLWMALLSHFIVYNFANMRVVFTLGIWWLALGLIANYLESQEPLFSSEIQTVTAFPGGKMRPGKTEKGLSS